MTTTKKANRILSFLLAMIMVLPLFTEFNTKSAYAAISGDWQYTVINGKAVISSYSGDSTKITVPAKIDGYSVSKITGLIVDEEKAANIITVTFSSGITELGDRVCMNFKKLTKVTIPSSVRIIGSCAFENCSMLTTISIPSSVKTIGTNLFKNCSALKKANINCGTTTIPAYTFNGCTRLTSVQLPANITSIGNRAFENCSLLPNITIPDTVREIGEYAFSGCTQFSGVITLPTAIEKIGYAAFNGCNKIESVIAPNNIYDIDERAFENCSSLKSIVLGSSLKRIGKYVFNGCKNLTKIVFGGEYINLNKIYDFTEIDPTIYYPSNLADKWSSYTDGKSQSYKPLKTISISGNKTITETKTLPLKITVTNSASLGRPYYITSSNSAIASVDANGVVTANAPGTAKITVTTINGASKSVTVKIKPKKITGVTATTLTTSSIKLTWNEGNNVAGYIIYRSTNKSSGYKKIATTVLNSYTDKGLTKGKTYYYKVRSYVKAGSTTLESASSSYDGAKATSPTPTSVSAKKSASKVALIKWGKSIGAEGYEVYMATSKSGTYSKISTVTSGSTLSYKKTGLKSGKTYYFKVRSYITVNGKKVYSDFTKVVKCKV